MPPPVFAFLAQHMPSKEEMELQVRISETAGLAGGGANSGAGRHAEFHHDFDGVSPVVQ